MDEGACLKRLDRVQGGALVSVDPVEMGSLIGLSARYLGRFQRGKLGDKVGGA